MLKFFLIRVSKKKSIYIALGIGAILSLLYIAKDVFPYRSYDGTPYTLWIECYTMSIYPAILFMLMPILAAMGMSDIYFCDQKNGYFNLMLSKGKKTSYFRALYFCNFVVGGLCFLFPLIVNIYCCFMLLPDRAPDLILEGTEVVPLWNSTTLFPDLYYAHPRLHMAIYLLIGFLAAGMFASISLCLSFFLKHRFLILISGYITNYLYASIMGLCNSDSVSSYLPTTFSRQVAGATELIPIIGVLAIGIAASAIIYKEGVRRRAIQ